MKKVAFAFPSVFFFVAINTFHSKFISNFFYFVLQVQLSGHFLYKNDEQDFMWRFTVLQ